MQIMPEQLKPRMEGPEDGETDDKGNTFSDMRPQRHQSTVLHGMQEGMEGRMFGIMAGCRQRGTERDVEDGRSEQCGHKKGEKEKNEREKKQLNHVTQKLTMESAAWEVHDTAKIAEIISFDEMALWTTEHVSAIVQITEHVPPQRDQILQGTEAVVVFKDLVKAIA